jgi:sRNA-binding regulator protein Hfq
MTIAEAGLELSKSTEYFKSISFADPVKGFKEAVESLTAVQNRFSKASKRLDMQVVITNIVPEHKEVKTQRRTFYQLEQYRIDYVLYLKNGVNMQGQIVKDNCNILNNKELGEDIINSIKEAFLEAEPG